MCNVVVFPRSARIFLVEKKLVFFYTICMTTLSEVARFFAESEHFSGTVREDEILAGHTTMHVGGKAGLFLGPADEDSLVFAIAELKRAGFPYFVLGGGSNLIVSDSGFDGAVVSTRGLKFLAEGTEDTEGESADFADGTEGEESSLIRVHPRLKSPASCVIVGAGASWGGVMAFCRERDLGGLEGFTGLSGTVGGAVYMNATCFGLSACDRLVSVRYLDTASGEICEYVMDEEKRTADWGYKKSPFSIYGGLGETCGQLPGGGLFASLCGDTPSPRRVGCGEDAARLNPGERLLPSRIILSATFALTKGFDAKKSDDCIAQRKEKGHFLAPSAGSVFKNMVRNGAAGGVIAGKVIDECGLKGLQIGGVQVAPWHGNFIVNTGGASAQDIFDLVQLIKKIVEEKKKILLECEIIFLGKFYLH